MRPLNPCSLFMMGSVRVVAPVDEAEPTIPLDHGHAVAERTGAVELQGDRERPGAIHEAEILLLGRQFADRRASALRS